jgi:hypothetical protein
MLLLVRFSFFGLGGVGLFIYYLDIRAQNDVIEILIVGILILIVSEDSVFACSSTSDCSSWKKP